MKDCLSGNWNLADSRRFALGTGPRQRKESGWKFARASLGRPWTVINVSPAMRDLDDLFAALARSRFRRGFSLAPRERAYLEAKGRPIILDHARDFVARRLAPEAPPNDGRQTPFRGHPVFVAQHATATCCRGCLAKWHHIAKGQALTPEEQAHVVAAIMRWLDAQEMKTVLPKL